MNNQVTELPAWSYSRMKDFRTCPKKYAEIKIYRNYKEDTSEAANYGTDFHKAAEEYVRDSKPLPEKYAYVKQYLDTLRQIPGTKYCEHKMALTRELEPCDFFAPNVWVRGVADYLNINEQNGVAHTADYKTGKSAKYADSAQLELMALMIFKHYPFIKRVKGGLLFVVANHFHKSSYDADKQHLYWRPWMEDHARMTRAFETGVWNPTQNGLCKKHCVITTCPHNGNH